MTNSEYSRKNNEFDDERHARITTVLGYSSNYIKTDKFEEADLKCRFGGMEVYFDKAKLNNGKGTVKVDLSFGAIELYIPKEWTVRNNAKVVLGAVEEKGNSIGGIENCINLMGSVSFGAVEIIYT